jgi:argininosuccinate synthase
VKQQCFHPMKVLNKLGGKHGVGRVAMVENQKK